MAIPTNPFPVAPEVCPHARYEVRGYSRYIVPEGTQYKQINQCQDCGLIVESDYIPKK